MLTALWISTVEVVLEPLEFLGGNFAMAYVVEDAPRRRRVAFPFDCLARAPDWPTVSWLNTG